MKNIPLSKKKNMPTENAGRVQYDTVIKVVGLNESVTSFSTEKGYSFQFPQEVMRLSEKERVKIEVVPGGGDVLKSDLVMRGISILSDGKYTVVSCGGLKQLVNMVSMEDVMIGISKSKRRKRELE